MANKKLINRKVKVYYDPVTKKYLEGHARILIDHDNDFYTVKFSDNGDIVGRVIYNISDHSDRC